MPLWLLEHKDPKAAQSAGHEVRSIVVSANDEDAARDMAVKERPTDKAGEKRPGKPYLDNAPAEDLWADRDRTTCTPIVEADSCILAVELFALGRKHA
jgi:hypothetical protein